MSTRKKTPIMGWASWNGFRTQISEEKLKRQADALVRTGLAAYGYWYFNMDDGFFGGRAADGTLLFHRERFPNGIRCVADYAHALGLKAGVYAEAGDKTCGFYYDAEGADGENAGLYGFEEADLHRFLVDFGFDFIKVDWCGGLRMGLNPEVQYTKIGTIIDKIRQETGREIVYNICCWRFPGEWAVDIADSWRTGADISPDFDSVMYQLDSVKRLQTYCGPGHVNDLDMMQIGNGMTLEEDRTHFAMWCMMSTPLMIGCDLEKISSQTLEILKNEELIAIDQDPACRQAYVAKSSRKKDGAIETEVWVKELESSSSCRLAYAFLNRSREEKNMTVSFEDLGLKGIVHIRDVSHHVDVDVKTDGVYTIFIPAHGVIVWKVIGTVRCAMPYAEHTDPGFENAVICDVSGPEARKLVDNGAVLLDVRPREEYEKAHLPGAVSMEYYGIHANAVHQIPDMETPLVLYCNTGKRSSQAIDTLHWCGYKKLYSLGRMDKWKE